VDLFEQEGFKLDVLIDQKELVEQSVNQIEKISKLLNIREIKLLIIYLNI